MWRVARVAASPPGSVRRDPCPAQGFRERIARAAGSASAMLSLEMIQVTPRPQVVRPVTLVHAEEPPGGGIHRASVIDSHSSSRLWRSWTRPIRVLTGALRRYQRTVGSAPSWTRAATRCLRSSSAGSGVRTALRWRTRGLREHDEALAWLDKAIDDRSMRYNGRWPRVDEPRDAPQLPTPAR